MKKIIYQALMLFTFNNINAQTAILTKNVNSTLTVNGSIQTKYREVDTSININEDDHYISYTGNTPATFTLPIIKSGNLSFAGRIYRIKNLSTNNLTILPQTENQLRLKHVPIDSYIIKPGGYIEAVNNTNTTGATWDLSFVGHPSTQQDIDFYTTQLHIPPHSTQGVPDWNNHANNTYDTNEWHIIRKESRNADNDRGAVMIIVYEYQGKPFKLTHLAPMLTVDVNTDVVNVYNSSVMSILNNGTNGKTMLTLAVTRNDHLLTTDAHWANTLIMNLLLVRRNI